MYKNKLIKKKLFLDGPQSTYKKNAPNDAILH